MYRFCIGFYSGLYAVFIVFLSSGLLLFIALLYSGYILLLYSGCIVVIYLFNPLFTYK